MEKKRTYCKKLSEIKSFEELGLSKRSIEILNDFTDLETVVTQMRWWHMTKGNVNLTTESMIKYLGMPPGDGFDQRAGKYESKYGNDVTGVLVDLENCVFKAGLINDTARDYYVLLGHFFDGYFQETLRRGWDTDEELNRWYEYFTCGWSNDKRDRILELLEEELTPAQFQMAKFELSHPKRRIYFVGHYDRKRSPECFYDDDGVNNFYYCKLTSEEYLVREAAIENISSINKDRILEILLS